MYFPLILSKNFFSSRFSDCGAGHGVRTRMRFPSPGLKPGVSASFTNPADGIRSRARTCDLVLVRHALYQLSYTDISGGS